MKKFIILLIPFLVYCGKDNTVVETVIPVPKEITVTAHKDPIPWCNGGGDIKITGLDANADSILDDTELTLVEVECDLVGVITFPWDDNYDCHVIGNGFICKIKKHKDDDDSDDKDDDKKDHK